MKVIMMFLSKLRVVACLVRLRQSLLALLVPCWRWAKIIEHLWDRKDFLPEIPEWLRGRKLVSRKLVKPLNIPNVEVGMLHVWSVFSFLLVSLEMGYIWNYWLFSFVVVGFQLGKVKEKLKNIPRRMYSESCSLFSHLLFPWSVWNWEL